MSNPRPRPKVMMLTEAAAGRIEYIVVHEMAHLLERTHNDRFVGLMDRFMPKWQFRREILNSLPLSHESWDY